MLPTRTSETDLPVETPLLTVMRAVQFPDLSGGLATEVLYGDPPFAAPDGSFATVISSLQGSLSSTFRISGRAAQSLHESF